jgi:uncharacterized membrane protein YqjE
MSDPAHAPERGAARGGVFASLQRTLATLVALAHTRLDLASAEIEEQAERLISLLMWGVAAVFIGSATLLICALALIVAFWETHRVLIAATLAVFMLIAAAVTIYGFISRARARPRLFEATLAELARDHERLTRQ